MKIHFLGHFSFSQSGNVKIVTNKKWEGGFILVENVISENRSINQFKTWLSKSIKTGLIYSRTRKEHVYQKYFENEKPVLGDILDDLLLALF